MRKYPGIRTHFFSSTSLRALQTALAVAEAFHPEIRPLMSNNPNNLNFTRMQEAVRKAGIQPYEKVSFKDFAERKPVLNLDQVLDWRKRLLREGTHHRIFVSHSEILGRLMREIESRIPDVRGHMTIRAKIEALQSRLDQAMEDPAYQKYRKRVKTNLERLKTDKRGEYNRLAKRHDLLAFGGGSRKIPSVRQVDELEEQLANLHAQIQVDKPIIDELGHFTFKFTPDSISVLFRGKEHPLPISSLKR